MNNEKVKNCELLTFRKGSSQATVATNGDMIVVQTPEEVRDFIKLWKAIAYLEARDWAIDTEGCKGF